MTDVVRIFDTTLRDGEQAPGFSMTPEGKLKMARALAALKVDVIEAGFAAASPGDFESIQQIARIIEGPAIASLARANRNDILASGKAIAEAPRRRIHTFIGTSPIHREYKLRMNREQVLQSIRDAVAYAREFTDDVEFSAEDAIRTERDYLVEVLSAAIEAGATTVNVPDTVGYTTPEEIYDLFSYLIKNVSHGPDIIFSAHCHDDLGMAVANSLAAVRAGARQIECAVNGIGERAGNCALEDAVMALRTRADTYGVTTNIDTTKIMAASRALSQVTNVHPPRNKSIVGANAFAHESGIHQHGMLMNRETYEIMKPEDIGLAIDGIVLGKHSGRHALAARAKALGHLLEGDKLDQAFTAFKTLADQIGIVDTARLAGLLASIEHGETDKVWTFVNVDIHAPVTSGGQSVARVELEHGTRGRVTETASARGGLDAAFKAVSRIVGLDARVEDLDMQYVAADPNEEASPEDQRATVHIEAKVSVNGETFAGRASTRDIVPGYVAAYLDAVMNAQAVLAFRAGKTGKAEAA
jgi:2-isopropylmalate synthase